MTTDPRDPLGLRADAPMLAAWLDFTRQAEAGELLPMSVPGHKQRQGLVGAVVAGDAPFYGGLDTIKNADNLRVESEGRAARLWGADWCRFSVAGSTHGNQALALAVGQPGREVIINRTLHRSLLLGLVLAGLRPVWVRPEIDPTSGLPAGVAVQTVRDALAAHPDACAVFLGDPTYVGTISDLAGAPWLSSRATAARDRSGRGRHGDQRAQGAACVYARCAGAGQDRATGSGAAGPGVRGNAHHEPDRVDHGEHRCGARAAGG